MTAPTGRPGGGRRSGPKGPPVGTIRTGMVVGQAKKGVLVDVRGTELLLARARFGAAAAQIEEAMYGDGLTIEVVADPGAPGGSALSRVGIERSVRQPRRIEGILVRDGSSFRLAPSDGSSPFAVEVLDHLEPTRLLGRQAAWAVGAPYRDRRFVVLDEA